MRHDEKNIQLSDALHVIYVELSKLEEILKKSVSEDIFSKWAELNKVEGVALIRYFFSDNGTETIREFPGDPNNSIVEYTVGDHYTLDITLSPEFSFYADGENGQLLIESLKTTFTNYHAPIQIDEFNLIISEQ